MSVPAVKVAPALVNLSIAYGALGQTERQRDLLELALRINEREYGAEHRAVATTLVNLGNTYGRLGDPQRQREILEKALRIKQREFGPPYGGQAAGRQTVVRARSLRGTSRVAPLARASSALFAHWCTRLLGS